MIAPATKRAADLFQKREKQKPIYGNGGEGNNPKSYATSVHQRTTHLDDANIDRDAVLALCRASSVPIEEKVIAILAWGGMHRGSFETFYERKANWAPVCEEILDGKLSRKQAYQRFFDLQHEGEIKGMGPAYYTKLIYFLMATSVDQPAGYIMDQWAACSINLLFNSPIVKMDSSYFWKKSEVQRSSFLVSPWNDGDVYEDFCQAIDNLRDALQVSPHELDYRLMSEGGKSPAPWRAYVIENRKTMFNGEFVS